MFLSATECRVSWTKRKDREAAFNYKIDNDFFAVLIYRLLLHVLIHFFVL